VSGAAGLWLSRSHLSRLENNVSLQRSAHTDLCVSVRVRMRVRACARVYVCARARVHVRARVCACVRVALGSNRMLSRPSPAL
jgi:hypothetical protein